MRQLAAVLRIETEFVLGQLCLGRLAGAAEFAIDWRFDDHTGSVLARSLRNFKVHVTIGGVDAGFLKKCAGDMKDLKLAASPRGVWGDESVLRPAQDGIDTDFYGWHGGNRLVLGEMAEVSDVRLDGNAFAKVFGAWLKDSEVLSGTGTSDDREEES